MTAKTDGGVDLVLKRGECRRNAGAAPAVALAQPVDREVSNDGDQPGGNTGRLSGSIRVLLEAGEVVGGKRLAHGREHIHDIVMVRDQALDGRDYESPISLGEQVPSGLRIAGIERGEPWLHADSDVLVRWAATYGWVQRVSNGVTGERRRETGEGDGSGRRETGDGRRETEGRRETGDGRRETGDGRRETGDGARARVTPHLSLR